MSLAGLKWENVPLTVDTAVSYHSIMKCWVAISHLLICASVLPSSSSPFSRSASISSETRWKDGRVPGIGRKKPLGHLVQPLFPPRGMPKPSFTFAQEWFHFLRKEWELDMCGLVSLSLGFIPKFNSGTWKGRTLTLNCNDLCLCC